MTYKYMTFAWRNDESNSLKKLMRERAILWRRQRVITRIEKPTRIDRARRLGYKAKLGYIVVRIRVRRGGLRKKRPKMGRRQKRMGVSKYKPSKSIQLIAEERVARKYPNLEVINSYWIWQDGRHKWFEVILADRLMLPDLGPRKGRRYVFRGLTSAGRKARGLSS